MSNAVTDSSAPQAVIVAEPAPVRLTSIDALRGFDMFWIIGAEEMVQAWLRYSHQVAGNKPSDTSTWQMMLHRQFEHATWEGFRFYDLIFPLFLFIIGVMIPFSLGKIKASGHGTWSMLGRIARRTLLILAFGFIYNDVLLFQFNDLRYTGVLQRLGICYGIAAILTLFCNVTTLASLTVLLLIGYYFLLLLVPAPGGLPGDITMEGSVAGYVDRLVFKETLRGKIPRAYYGFGDNEGILSTIPSVATALLGVLAGYWLRTRRSVFQKFLGLFWSGLILLAFGAAWSGFFMDMNNLHDRPGFFPIIKNLWTSTYVLWAGGWSLLLLALFFGVIDGLGLRFWSWPFVFIGANAITIYLIDHFIQFEPLSRQLFGGVIRIWADSSHSTQLGDAANKSLNLMLTTALVLTGSLFLKWLITWFLYRNKIFLRA